MPLQCNRQKSASATHLEFPKARIGAHAHGAVHPGDGDAVAWLGKVHQVLPRTSQKCPGQVSTDSWHGGEHRRTQPAGRARRQDAVLPCGRAGARGVRRLPAFLPHLACKHGHGVGGFPLWDLVGVLLHLHQLLVQEDGAVVHHLHRKLGLQGRVGCMVMLRCEQSSLGVRKSRGCEGHAWQRRHTWQAGLGHLVGSLTLPRSFHESSSAPHCMHWNSARLRAAREDRIVACMLKPAAFWTCPAGTLPAALCAPSLPHLLPPTYAQCVSALA